MKRDLGMSVPTVLAKALYDNIADNADELTFRKGDVITVLEKDIDGLYGWWLCSLHGRQGIAPGNRLSEIVKEPEPDPKSPALEYSDYAVPRPYEENGEDYDVPRSVFSPQDYDFPKPESSRFEYPPDSLKEVITPPVDDNTDNVYQEIYDVPVSTPEKKKPDLIQPEKLPPPKRPPSPKRGPQSPTKQAPPKTLTKPPRKINTEKSGSLKGTQPPPRPPKPVSPRSPKPVASLDVYDVPAVKNIYELPHTKTSNTNTTNITNNDKNSIECRSSSGSQSSDKSSTAASPRLLPEDTSENVYDVPPVESTADDTYDVPPSAARVNQNDLQDQGGEIYDIPARLPAAIDVTPRSDLKDDNHLKATLLDHSTRLQPLKNQFTEDNSKRSSGGSETGGLKVSSSIPGKRGSNSSSGSGKTSSEDDDYVDYQEIYGFGRGKPVNVYDVPAKPVQVVGESATKQTKVSILQRINMSAVKGIKLDPPAALQRLTKLEQAVDVTVNKLLSFVSSTWRDVTLLKPKMADIRDVTGKAKVVLRLLTEFGLSTLVNAQKIGNHELTGKLSRAIEPLLETYYSLKLTLQRLDDGDWRAPLERMDNKDDDLDLIMVYIRSVPEDSKKLASVIRMAATILYKLPKDPLPLPKETKEGTPVQFPRKDSLQDTASKTKSSSSTENNNAEEVVAKIEKFKPLAMEAESSDVNSTTMMVGLIKACVDANIKPSDKPKLSPDTVRRLCGIDSQGGLLQDSKDSIQKEKGNEEGTPKLPPRKPSNSQAPKPPMRQDSTERLRHVRQKSLERFAPEGETKPKDKVPPTPPPKPKLDRKPTMRKSYKTRVKEENEGDVQNTVKFREHKLFQIGDESPQGKRKCNSDPTELERNTDSETNSNYNNNSDIQKPNRVSDSLETTVPGNAVGSKSPLASSRSDSALPNTANGQNSVSPLSPKVKEYSHHLKPDPQVQRSKSFSRTKPPPPKVPFGENGMNEFILSFSDKELLEFYKYEIDAQLFVLNEAMKALFSSIEENKPPKIFVSNSKFVVLSAHKFIYIGETLQSKISHDKLGSDITRVTSKLSECVKSLVHFTKVAALQYSAITPMREMATAAAAVSDAAIELHKVVKCKVTSKQIV